VEEVLPVAAQRRRRPGASLGDSKVYDLVGLELVRQVGLTVDHPSFETHRRGRSTSDSTRSILSRLNHARRWRIDPSRSIIPPRALQRARGSSSNESTGALAMTQAVSKRI
jgi:hypothetical protein